MTVGTRFVDSTGVAAISGAPLRPRHQVHAFTSRLSRRSGRAATVQVRADNALIINAKGKCRKWGTGLHVHIEYSKLSRKDFLQGVAMLSSVFTWQSSC